MQRLTTGLAAVAILFAVVVWSGQTSSTSPAVQLTAAPSTGPNGAPPQLKIAVAEQNPWTKLAMNAQNRNFQFAVVTDRTGGHRPGVFAEAVNKLNLMQPEFVISVGDLIEGYTEDNTQWALEWAEFQGKVQQLDMPFFYVPGNHDMSNAGMSKNWQRKFGKAYYDFRYHDVLFLALNSDDPFEIKGQPFRFSQEQLTWVKDAIQKNRDVRHTFIFMHKPIWTYPAEDLTKIGWTDVEQALGERPYTVFAGHKHNYAHYVRNGRDYIMLATTGGGSKLRGKADGEFDQITWVTMRDNTPIIANLLLEGIEDKYLRTLPLPKPTPKTAAPVPAAGAK